MRAHDEDESDSQAGHDAATLRELVRQAQRAGSLGAAEQDRLLGLAALGDRASQERLVPAHLGMVIRLAAARGGQGLSVPDLVQEGSIGLVEAIRLFPTGNETDFAGFAETRIAAQMDAAIAAEAAAVREGELLVAAATDYERVEFLMSRLLHRRPTDAELAEKLEWTIERTRYVGEVVANARRRHDEELLAFIDPEAIDFDGDDDDERAELDG